MSYLRIDIIKKVAFPVRIGKAIKDLDCALPGPYIKIIYDNLSKNNTAIIAQLHTGNARLRLFLARIKATNSVIYIYKAASESIRYFLFSYQRWTCQRREMDTKYLEKEGNIRFFLGAKGSQDDEMWTLNINMIRATICFMKSTKRFKKKKNV